jgi:hypothetical protein
MPYLEKAWENRILDAKLMIQGIAKVVDEECI